MDTNTKDLVELLAKLDAEVEAKKIAMKEYNSTIKELKEQLTNLRHELEGLEMDLPK